MLDIIIPTIKTQPEIATMVDEILATAGCPVNVIATCQQISASKNRNFGLNCSTNEHIIMVDDDVEQFPINWALQLSNVLTTYPNCVMVSAQLANQDGTAGYMMGGCQIHKSGITAAHEHKLPTACVAVRRNNLRFNEDYLGSGIEDDDYCLQLCKEFPSAEFLVCHSVWVVHRNERKFGTEFWNHNVEVFNKRWGFAHW
jgi:hypothetical protein